MPLTLLQIIQQTQMELGLPVAATVVGNLDATTTQMFALSNRCLDELRRMNRWTACQFEYDLIVNTPTITTGDLGANSAVITNIPSTAGIVANYFTVGALGVPQAARVLSVDSLTQVTMTMEATGAATATDVTFAQDTYPLPTDIDFYNNATWWDRTNRWRIIGPDSPQQDQFQRSGIVAIGPRRHFRQLGPFADRLRIWPPPVEITAPLQLVWEYLSLNAVAVNGSLSSFAQFFANDNDQPLLDAQAIIKGIKYLFWQVKGFNYVDFKNDWIDYVDKLIARDGAAPTLTLARNPVSLLISSANVQDGNYPGTSSDQ